MLVDLPFAFEDFSKGAEALLDFYKKLGWNPDKQLIDPTKVVLNSKDADQCLTNFMSAGETADEQAKYGLFWMNQGPGHSEKVPPGKVELKENWVEDE